jgi:polyhydroxyalkanoate synthesis regulator protein
MQSFAHNQEQIQQYMSSLGGLFPFAPQLEEMGKQNMALFQNAIKMFAPFPMGKGGMGVPGGAEPTGDEESELQRLRQELEEMQRRLGELSRKKTD